MTRAWIYALHFEFQKAFYYHPLFWLVPILGMLYINRDKLAEKIYHISLFFMMTVFLSVYFIRLLEPENTVVTILISDGMFAKIIHYVLEMLI